MIVDREFFQRLSRIARSLERSAFPPCEVAEPPNVACFGQHLRLSWSTFPCVWVLFLPFGVALCLGWIAP